LEGVFFPVPTINPAGLQNIMEATIKLYCHNSSRLLSGDLNSNIEERFVQNITIFLSNKELF